jgi:hypothetical protein
MVGAIDARGQLPRSYRPIGVPGSWEVSGEKCRYARLGASLPSYGAARIPCRLEAMRRNVTSRGLKVQTTELLAPEQGKPTLSCRLSNLHVSMASSTSSFRATSAIHPERNLSRARAGRQGRSDGTKGPPNSSQTTSSQAWLHEQVLKESAPSFSNRHPVLSLELCIRTPWVVVQRSCPLHSFP